MQEIPIRACGVAVVLIRDGVDTRHYLLLRRTRRPVGAWTYAAGGIQEGETASEAAIREVKEETGLDVLSLYSADVCEQFYQIEKDSIWMAPVFVGFLERDSRVIINEEHSEYRWCNMEEAVSLLTYPGAGQILETVHRQFVERAPSPYLRIL